MAMNKKEAAQLNEALTQARFNRALSWSRLPETPDVKPPSGIFEFANGWTFTENSIYPSTPKAYEAWTESSYHGDGHRDPDAPRTQRRPSASHGARWLFSTKLRALYALRRALERKFAAVLAEVDLAIEIEEAIAETSRDQG